MRNKAFIIFMLAIMPLPTLSGQNKPVRSEAPPLIERLTFGGSFGLQLGTVTNIEVSPVIGLWVLPRVMIAAGPVYQYYNSPLGETDIWGQRAFLQLVVLRNIDAIIPIGAGTSIFFHTEYEGLGLKSDFWTGINDNTRFYVHSFLTGPGVSQQIGRRSSMYISVLWALNQSDYEIYSKPEIRFGFLF